MTRDDVVRELKAYRAHLAAEMRKTDAALKAFGILVDDAVAPSRPTRTASAGGTRPPVASENGTYELLRRIAPELPPGESLDAREAIELLEVYGWQSDAKDRTNAVNSAMNRLAGWGEWEKVGRGRYRPRRADQPGSPAEPPGEPVAEPVAESAAGRAAAVYEAMQQTHGSVLRPRAGALLASYGRPSDAATA